MPEMRVRQVHEWFGEIENALSDNEAVRYVCGASKDFVKGLFAVTDSRLIWVTKKSIWSLKTGAISTVRLEKGAIRSSVSSLTIEADGIKHEFAEMESACAQDVVSLAGGSGSAAVALAVSEVPVPEPKPIKPMGGIGLLTTVAAFVGGALAVFPWLRDLDMQSPLKWPFAALGLFLAAGLLGQFADFMTRAFVNGFRRGVQGKG
jgi:hypothetical protein